MKKTVKAIDVTTGELIEKFPINLINEYFQITRDMNGRCVGELILEV